MLANLWGKLQVHPFRYSRDPLDQQALLLYQAEQRRAWHQAIDTPAGAWDIGTLCEISLSRARDDIYREDRRRVDNERDYFVSPSFLFVRTPLTVGITYLSPTPQTHTRISLQHKPCDGPPCFHAVLATPIIILMTI